MFEEIFVDKVNDSYEESIAKAKKAFVEANAVVVGAGSGLSTAAGYTYAGERFDKYFSDFKKEYGIRDMYSGGFYLFPDRETQWAWWARHIWLNRYVPIPNNTYEILHDLVKGKDYFVLTTNVDHCFQRAGFDRQRLFYTQGDYGLFQSSAPFGASAGKTYDNEAIVRKMILAEGFEIGDNGELIIPQSAEIAMRVPTELVPYCPDDGEPMTMNLRSDDTFVEDDGWHKAAERYDEFIRRHGGLKIVYFELGVGGNTPVIIKYPFWRMTAENKAAKYICVNKGEAMAPREIMKRAICIDADIRQALMDMSIA